MVLGWEASWHQYFANPLYAKTVVVVFITLRLDNIGVLSPSIRSLPLLLPFTPPYSFASPPWGMQRIPLGETTQHPPLFGMALINRASHGHTPSIKLQITTLRDFSTLIANAATVHKF